MHNFYTDTQTSGIQRRVFAMALALAAVVPLASHAQQPAWPNRPIKMIAPVSAGSSIDIVMRSVVQAMSVHLGQPIVIENRTGASGVIGTTVIARAPADGYTLGVVSINHVINPAAMKDIPYDTLKDFTPISTVASGGMVLLAHPSLNVRTWQEFLEAAKKAPGQITYGSSGNGGLLHLFTAQVEHQAGIDLRHIPFNGLAPMMQNLTGGHVQVGMAALPAAQPFIASGQLRVLAVTSRSRMSAVPQIPSLSELGLSGYDSTGWMALVGPAGLPAAIQNRVHDALKLAMADPKVAETVAAAGMEAIASTPEQAARFMRTESEKHLASALRVGLKPQ
jgi:tripartite-type tricarboxylate transporter receptor subunit TctC